MADSDVILEAGATIDIAPYEAGLSKMIEETASGTGAIKTSFESVAAADVAVSKSVQSVTTETLNGFVQTKTSGILAFDALRGKVIETTAEVARLRAEILQTNDQTRLDQLQTQLRRATQEMTAARTELRALRFEAAETTEKANLLGESVGVRIPGALGHLLGRIPLVQEAMAAAFSVAIVGIFIETLLEMPEAIGKIVDKLVEWDEQAKKTYQNQIKLNDEVIAQNLELAKGRRELTVIGTEGSRRESIETANLRQEQLGLANDYKVRQGQIEETKRRLEELHATQTQEEHDRLGSRAAEAQIGQNIINWITRANEEIKEQQNRYTELEAAQAKNAARQREINQITVPKLAVTTRIEELDRELKDEVSATETRKKIADSYVEYFSAGTKRLFSLNQLNLDEEVVNEKLAADQKLENFKTYTAQRISEAQKEAVIHPGKDIGPEVATLNANLEVAELAHATTIANIDAAADEKRLSHANAVSRALAQASKSATDLEVTDDEAAARRKLSLRQITIDQETVILKDGLAKRIAAERALLEEELRIANQDPNKNQAQIITLNQQLVNLKKEQIDKEVAITEDGETRKRELARREQEEELRFARETSSLVLEQTRRSDEVRLRAHEITLSQWAGAETIALNRWYDAQRVTMESAAEFARKTFGETSLEYRKALNEMSLLDQKFANDRERIDERVAANFQQTMNVVSGSFSSAFDQMLTQHTKFSTVMQTFWNQMVEGWGRMGIQIVGNYVQSLAQIVLQEALTALKINVIHTQSTSAKKATETFFDAFLSALGIKRVAQTTAEATAQKAVDTAETGATVAQETAKTAAITTGEAARTAAATAGAAARTTAEAAGQTAAVAAVISSNELKIGSDAGAAGAAAFASVMEALPFPINVSTAPEVAAAAVAQTLGFLAVGAAEKGAVLKEDMLIAAHKNETILPPPISLGLQNLISAGGLQPPSVNVPPELSNPAGPTTNNTGGATTNNYKTVNVKPEIHVHQHGDENGRMSHEELADAISVGVRRGLIPTIA
jgi:hypothetical protein